MLMFMRHGFMIMFVITSVLTMNMNMGMNVCMFMGMDDITMLMLMGMCMRMLMCVLQFNSVPYQKVSAGNHYHQCKIKLACRSFT